MSTTFTILCGACKLPAKAPLKPEPHDQVTCPGCGRSDRFDDVVRTVQEHVAYEVQQTFAAGMAKAARSSKRLTFKPQRGSQSTFRWVAGKPTS